MRLCSTYRLATDLAANATSNATAAAPALMVRCGLGIGAGSRGPGPGGGGQEGGAGERQASVGSGWGRLQGGRVVRWRGRVRSNGGGGGSDPAPAPQAPGTGRDGGRGGSGRGDDAVSAFASEQAHPAPAHHPHASHNLTCCTFQTTEYGKLCSTSARSCLTVSCVALAAPHPRGRRVPPHPTRCHSGRPATAAAVRQACSRSRCTASSTACGARAMGRSCTTSQQTPMRRTTCWPRDRGPRRCRAW